MAEVRPLGPPENFSILREWLLFRDEYVATAAQSMLSRPACIGRSPGRDSVPATPRSRPCGREPQDQVGDSRVGDIFSGRSIEGGPGNKEEDVGSPGPGYL